LLRRGDEVSVVAKKFILGKSYNDEAEDCRVKRALDHFIAIYNYFRQSN